MIRFRYLFIFSILFVANLSQAERMVSQATGELTPFVPKTQPNSQFDAFLKKEKIADPPKVPP